MHSQVILKCYAGNRLGLMFGWSWAVGIENSSNWQIQSQFEILRKNFTFSWHQRRFPTVKSITPSMYLHLSKLNGAVKVKLSSNTSHLLCPMSVVRKLWSTGTCRSTCSISGAIHYHFFFGNFKAVGTCHLLRVFKKLVASWLKLTWNIAGPTILHGKIIHAGDIHEIVNKNSWHREYYVMFKPK